MKTKKTIGLVLSLMLVLAPIPAQAEAPGTVRVEVLAELPPEFRAVYYVGERLFGFETGDWHNGEKEQYGLCDEYGNIVLPAQYDYILCFSEGLLVVRKDDKWGFVNGLGEFAIPMEYDVAYSFSGGVAEIFKGEKRGFIDKSGNMASPLREREYWYHHIYAFSEGLAVVYTDKGCGYIDNTGELVLKTEYYEAYPFSEGLALVKKDGKYGYIDKTGKEVIPCVHDFACSFAGGLAVVAAEGIRAGSEMQYINGKYGYIDKSGDVVVPLEYDYACDFSEGLAAVGKGGEWVSGSDSKGYTTYRYVGGKYGHIDTHGDTVVPLDYDAAGDFGEGFALVGVMVQHEDYYEPVMRYGYVDATGSLAIPPQYQHAFGFSEGLAAAIDYMGDNNGLGYIDTKGNIAVPLEYDNTYTDHCFKDRLVAARKDDRWVILGIVGADAAPFTDVKEADWFYGDVMYAYEAGLIDGKGANRFAPDDNLTYAEAVKLAACMHELQTGSVTLAVGSGAWYDSYVDYAKANGIIEKDYEWDAPASRAGYMEIFAGALPEDALAAVNAVADGAIPDVPADHPQAAAIYRLYRAGIVQGVDAEHSCNPDASIRRCEVAAILTRMMNPDARVRFGLE